MMQTMRAFYPYKKQTDATKPYNMTQLQSLI